MIYIQIIAVLVILFIYKIYKWWTNALRRIPGPTPLPFIGNVHQTDAKRPHLQFTKWARKYGDIFCVNLMGDYTVVVNSAKTIHELLVTKGKEFGGRPATFRVLYACYGGKDLSFRSYSAKLKHMRKVAHWALKTFGVGMNRLESAVEIEVQDMLDEMSKFKGQAFDPHPVLHTTVISVMTSLIFDKRFTRTSDEVAHVMAFDRCLSLGLHPIKGAELDAFPWLRFFGNTTFKLLKEGVQARDSFLNKHISLPRLKEAIDPDNMAGIINALILNTGIGNTIDHQPALNEEEIKALVFDLIIAGSITTSMALTFTFLVLLNYPTVQTKLYLCINKVVPRDRLPTLEDRPNMPYLDAFILEILRYTSHVPLSLPHVALTDTSIGGFDIPKGTQVLPNLWSVAHDEKCYIDPWEFKPERFLDVNGDLVLPDHPTRRNLLSFGAGRRICIGENLAKTRLFLIIGAIVQKFHILPEDANNIPSADPRVFTIGLVLLPDAFKCRLRERHVD